MGLLSYKYARFNSTPCATSCATMWLICVGPLLRGTLAGIAANDLPRRMSSTNAERFPRGPHSTNRRTPSANIVSIIRVNSTGRTQWFTASCRIALGSAGNGSPVEQQ